MHIFDVKYSLKEQALNFNSNLNYLASFSDKTAQQIAVHLQPMHATD